jgi:isopentenyl-diphosphate delta-isomerase
MSNNDSQKVILVDENDRQTGLEDKLKAHQNGAKLHRAFSVFVFNSKGETMLQQRAMTKYHSKGKWSNTCCSHPYPGETVVDAAHRRLREEMGFDCEMQEAFSFTYRADVGNGLTEHEFDHVFFGSYDGTPTLNKDEAIDYKWISLDVLKTELQSKPEEFTPWLRIVIERIISSRNNRDDKNA